MGLQHMATLQELAELVGEDVEEDADTLDLEDKELSEVPAAVCSLEAVEEVCASKTAKSICPELALLSRLLESCASHPRCCWRPPASHAQNRNSWASLQRLLRPSPPVCSSSSSTRTS